MKLCWVTWPSYFFLLTEKKKYLFMFSIKFSGSFSFYVNSKRLFMLLQDCVFFNAEFVLRLYINEGVLESSQPDFAKSDQNLLFGWQLFSISHNGIINSIPCNVSSNKQINILTVLIILRIFFFFKFYSDKFAFYTSLKILLEFSSELICKLRNMHSSRGTRFSS